MNERGSGVIGTTFGVGVFLALLFFASHLLLNLWATTTVDAVAHDAALEVALSGLPPGNRGAIEARALSRARASLGRYAAEVELNFVPARANEVAIHVRAPGLRLLPAVAAGPLGIEGVDRTIVVTSEEIT